MHRHAYVQGCYHVREMQMYNMTGYGGAVLSSACVADVSNGAVDNSALLVSHV